MPQSSDRATLAAATVAALEGEILAQRWKAGERLPPESALATEFVVSRPVLREALSRLRERGYLRTVTGSGTFVAYPDVGALAESFRRYLAFGTDESALTVEHLYEARVAIESAAVRLAATRPDPRDLAELRHRLSEMVESRADAVRFAAADVGFHVALARASRNPLLPVLLGTIIQLVVEGVTESHTPAAAQVGIDGHARILDELAVASPERAVCALEAHLETSRRLFPSAVVERRRPRSGRTP